MKKNLHKITDSSLKAKLVASYLLFIVIPVVILVLVTNNSIENTMVEQTGRAYQDTLRQVDTNVSYTLAKAAEISDRIQDSADFQRFFEARLQTPLTREEEIDYFYQTIPQLYSYEQTNHVLRVSLFSYGPATRLEANERYASAVLVESEPALKPLKDGGAIAMWVSASDLVGIKPVRQDSILYVRAVQRPQQYKYVTGYIAIEMDSSFIWTLLSRINIAADAKFLISSEGEVIRSTSAPAVSGDILGEYSKNQPGFPSAGIGQYHGRQGHYYIITENLASLNWYVSLLLTDAELGQNAVFIRNLTIGVAVLLVLFSVLLAVWLSNSITRRLNRLMPLIEDAGKGKFSTLEGVEGNDEFAKLQKSFNQMIERIDDLIQDVYQAQIDRQKAEMTLLYAQINPHFLYNTLDIIKWSAVRSGNHELSRVTESLARYLRLRLNNGREMVTVSQEIEQIRHYVEIMNYRYKNAISLELDTAPETMSLEIIKMLLQPLLENAILHGVMETPEKTGVIRIVTFLEDGYLYLRVIDDGVGMSKEQIEKILSKDSKDGYGIKNVHQRVQTYYGEDSSLSFESELGRGCAASIKIRLSPHRGLTGKL